MRELEIFPYVEAKLASEIEESHLTELKAGCFLSVSQSGETMDLLIPFRLASKHGL